MRTVKGFAKAIKNKTFVVLSKVICHTLTYCLLLDILKGPHQKDKD